MIIAAVGRIGGSVVAEIIEDEAPAARVCFRVTDHLREFAPLQLTKAFNLRRAGGQIQSREIRHSQDHRAALVAQPLRRAGDFELAQREFEPRIVQADLTLEVER